MEDIAPRYPVDLTLEVAVDGKKTQAKSHDVSLRGLGAYIPWELEPGQQLDITMRIPFKRDDLIFRAIVRNRKGFRYGLEFSRMQRPHEEVLQGLCDTLGNLGAFSPFEA